MLTITYIGTDNHNPGDTITDIGVRGLMSTALGPHYPVSVMLRDDVPVERYRLPPSDVLVLSGTPWVWDSFAQCPKVKALQHILARDESSLRIVMGAGSCYLPGYPPGKSDIAAVRQVFGSFDAIFCRDRLAYEVFEEALGERARWRPCPASYAAEVLGITASRHEELALVFLDPYHCFNGSFQSPETQAAIMDHQIGLMQAGARVVCMTEGDASFYRSRFGEPHLASARPKEIVEYLGRFQHVVSGRIHGAVPPLSMGARCEVLPLDSRILTATALGATVRDVGTDLDWGSAELLEQKAEIPELGAFATEIRALARPEVIRS
jgi:hypothetical protein